MATHVPQYCWADMIALQQQLLQSYGRQDASEFMGDDVEVASAVARHTTPNSALWLDLSRHNWQHAAWLHFPCRCR